MFDLLLSWLWRIPKSSSKACRMVLCAALPPEKAMGSSETPSYTSPSGIAGLSFQLSQAQGAQEGGGHAEKPPRFVSRSDCREVTLG